MKPCPYCKERPFVTEYWDATGRSAYRTFSPTLAHAGIRRRYPKSRTLRYDYTVKDWPFGVWAEVLAEGEAKRAKGKVQP